MLRQIRFGIVTFNGKELSAEAEVPETASVVLNRLTLDTKMSKSGFSKRTRFVKIYGVINRK